MSLLTPETSRLNLRTKPVTNHSLPVKLGWFGLDKFSNVQRLSTFLFRYFFLSCSGFYFCIFNSKCLIPYILFVQKYRQSTLMKLYKTIKLCNAIHRVYPVPCLLTYKIYLVSRLWMLQRCSCPTHLSVTDVKCFPVTSFYTLCVHLFDSK